MPTTLELELETKVSMVDEIKMQVPIFYKNKLNNPSITGLLKELDTLPDYQEANFVIMKIFWKKNMQSKAYIFNRINILKTERKKDDIINVQTLSQTVKLKDIAERLLTVNYAIYISYFF